MTDAEIPGAIELLVGLLGLAALVAIVVRRLRVPYTVALVVAGLLVGLAAGAAGFPPIDVSPDLVLLVLLPGLVFEAAYRLRIAELRRWIGGLVLLAIPGVLISAAIVAVVLTLATGLPIGLSFIVGAMVSATDPAAVVATFKRLRVPPALSTVVDGESLLNDGTGLVLFALAVQAVAAPLGPGEAIVSFVATIVLSLAIGLGTGYLTLLGRLKAGVTRAQADEQMRIIDRRYQTANPEKVDAKAGMSTVSFHEDLVGPQRPMLLTLFAAVGCVLLVACAMLALLDISVVVAATFMVMFGMANGLMTIARGAVPLALFGLLEICYK
jgi:hypothetical protein